MILTFLTEKWEKKKITNAVILSFFGNSCKNRGACKNRIKIRKDLMNKGLSIEMVEKSHITMKRNR